MMTPSSQPKKMSPVHQAPPPPPPPPTNTDEIMPIISSSPSSQKPTKRYMVLLVLNYMLLFVGSLASSLLAKFYFIHNGSSRWVSTWVQCAGFPILIIPIVLPYMFELSPRKPFKKFTKRLILLSMIIGVLFFLNNFLISWGTSYLPVSTSSLLLSSQLVFTLILSCLIVKQKITFNNLNCVILLTISSVLLALISSHDHPEGVTKRMYFIGYFCTIGAGLLFSLYLPLMEKIYREVYCYEMVVEMQFVMEFTTTVIATIAMAAAGGFKEMKRESMVEYDLGHNMYWLTVMGNIISWQVCFMGTAGMVFLTTSLTGGVCMTALLALNVIGGVLVYGDNFSGPKAVSTVICAWGFCSYVYGLYVNREKGGTDEKNRAKEMTQILIDEH
ncbi:probable purine permease 4 [Chenopodium quinoa]|uniref:probable purine permease 4 n=1 Tax=Chenopodium quinoa TaxID=63459 RepID=UPI000B773DE8|nr:probable purine permease 4 [Chenopodium quinoa]